jgi:hypothetical protein
MLFELEPDESLTGGFAYGENKQFDDAYVTAILFLSLWRFYFSHVSPVL